MFKSTFSDSLENIRMSPIVSISEEVRRRERQLADEGKSFIRFQRGEIDFPTPRFVIEAAKEGLDKGLTKYPKSGGEGFLKEAILRKMSRDYGVEDLTAENIVATYGGQEGLELSFKLFSRGAGFSPTWSCALENFVPYAELDFTEVPLNPDFSLDEDRLEWALRNSEFFYLNNPQNPTGKVFSRQELDRIVELCNRHECYIISDEAYEKFVYDGLEHHSLTSVPQDNIISVFTLSKTFSMTGWRIGFVVTRNTKIAKLLRLGNYTQTAGVTTFMQYAAAQALDRHEEAEAAISEMRAEFAMRRDALYDCLKDLPGVRLGKPQGAFYMFPDFGELIPDEVTGKSRERHVYEILLSHGIASVYGACFGRHFVDNVRFSFSATPLDVIADSGERFRKIFAAGERGRAS